MARAENGNWVSQKWQMDLASSVCENLSKDKFRNTKCFLHSIFSGSHNGTNEIVVFRKMLENCSGQRCKLEVGRVRILLPRSQNPTLKRKKYICEGRLPKKRENVGIFPKSGTPSPLFGNVMLKFVWFILHFRTLGTFIVGGSPMLKTKKGSGIRVDPPCLF